MNKWLIIVNAIVLVSTHSRSAFSDQQHPLRVHSAVTAGHGWLDYPTLHQKRQVAPAIKVRRYAAGDGFPEASVRQFAQSSDGTIWMVTEHGAYAFDGQQVRHFDTGSLHDAVCVQPIDRNGEEEIWVGTKTGLARLSIPRKTIVYVHRFAGEHIHCIGTDHTGRALVGTADGLFIEISTGFQRVGSCKSGAAAFAIAKDAFSKTTWVGTSNGLFKLNGMTLQPSDCHLPRSRVSALHVDSNGALWIGTDSSLLRMRMGQVSIVYQTDEPRSDFVRDICESFDGDIRVALATAAVRIADKQAESPQPKVYSRRAGTTSEFVDRDGSRWVGLPRTIKCDQVDLLRYTEQHVEAVLRQPNSDVVWFTEREVGRRTRLSRIRNGEFEFWKLPKPSTGLLWYENEVLVGTERGIFHVDGEQVVPHPIVELQSGRTFDFAVTPDGSLWAALTQGVFRIAKGKIVGHQPSMGGETVRRLAISKTAVTLATQTKIYNVDQDFQLLEEIDFSKGVASRHVNDVLRTDDGVLWVGTSNGLFKQAKIGSPLELVCGEDRQVGSFLVDAGRGQIWAGAMTGVCRIDQSTGVMQQLLAEDGFGLKRINTCYRDGQYTWFAGGDGLFRYKDHADAPRLIIDRITTDRELLPGTSVSTTTDCDLVSVDFHAIVPSMRNGSTIYRYRLFGENDKWSETRNPHVDYQHLAAGEYSLQVQAFNQDLVPSEVAVVPITVSLPKLRYATYGLLAMSMLLLIGGAGWLMFSQRLQNKRMAAQVATEVDSRLRLEDELRNSQKLESLGTLASGMAHDFNNMLQVVYTSSECAKLSDDRETIFEHVDAIQDAAEQAHGLIRSILTLAGRHETNVQSVDLADLTSKCVNMMRRTTPQSVRIELQTCKEDVLGSVDPEQINQALFNLLINARDAMPNGGTMSVSIRPHAQDDQQWVQIEVRDTGMGIDPEQHDKIFDPFYTTKTREEGTGLGLATVHAIIRRHEGFITVQSEPQDGTCFTIRLPRIDASESKSILRIGQQSIFSGTARPVSTRRARTVLVAEDHPMVRKLIVGAFGNDCRVLVAENGARALELAHEERPDVMILDVDMPILDGITVLKRLRASGNNTRAVIVTGARPDGPLPGNTIFLAKPFTIAQLLSATFDKCEQPQIAKHG